MRIPENKKAIEVAREHGDLRENAEYHMAKDDQKVLDARRGELEKTSCAPKLPTSPKSATTKWASVLWWNCSKAHLAKSSPLYLGHGIRLQRKHRFLQNSLGTSLIGRKVNEEVEIDVDGSKENWTLKSISRWVDQVSA